MDVRSAVEEFFAAKLTLSKHTQKNYRVHLTVFVAWCEEQGLQLENLTARHIRTFIEVVSRRNSPYGGTLKRSTIQQYAIAVKAFLKWCMKEEDFETMVSPKVILQVQLPKLDQMVIETFSPEQLEAMLRATEKQPFPVRDKAILSVLIDTGVRASELCGLTLNCVWMDSDDSYIRVTGKGRKEREISLGRTARIALRRYITRYRKPKNKADQHVFLSRTGERLTTSGLAQIVEQIALTARIKDVRCSPHTFRHTYAVQYLLNGGDLYKLSRTMGHTSVKITERYLGAIKAKQARQGQSVLDQLKTTL
jgi:site-specific recombinase XerD